MGEIWGGGESIIQSHNTSVISKLHNLDLTFTRTPTNSLHTAFTGWSIFIHKWWKIYLTCTQPHFMPDIVSGTLLKKQFSSFSETLFSCFQLVLKNPDSWFMQRLTSVIQLSLSKNWTPIGPGFFLCSQ